MRITFNGSQFRKAGRVISKAAKAARVRGHGYALDWGVVTLRVHLNQISLGWRDFDGAFSFDMPFTIMQGAGGETLFMDAESFVNALSVAKGDSVALEQADAGFTLTSGAATASIAGATPEAAGEMSDKTDSAVRALKAAHIAPIDMVGFADAMAFVQPAVSTEETRYYLNGAFVTVHGAHVTAVATDGHRLNYVPITGSNAIKSCWPWANEDARRKASSPGYIIPRLSVAHIVEMAALSKALHKGVRSPENVPSAGIGSWRADNTYGRIGNANWSVIWKHVDGNFPQWERILPADIGKHGSRFPLSRAMLDGAKDIAKAFRKQAVVMSLTPGKVGLRSRDNDKGTDISLSYDAAAEGVQEREVGFNTRYLAEALSPLASGATGTLTLGAAEPCLFVYDSGERTVLMPMKY